MEDERDVRPLSAGEIIDALATGHPSDGVRMYVRLRLPGGRSLELRLEPVSARYELVDSVIEMADVELTEMDLLLNDFMVGGGLIDSMGYPEELVRYAEARGRSEDEVLGHLREHRREWWRWYQHED